MKKAVLFDMDGTLINTLEDLTDAVSYVMEKNSYPKRSIKEVRSFVGNGVKKLIERSLPENISEEIINKCFEEMLEYYSKNSMVKTGPYRGVVELVKNLKSKGYKLAIVTNKVEDAAIIISQKFFGSDIEIIIGDNKKDPLKPHPMSIERALSELGVSREEAYYIGDSEVDVLTAKNANVDFIGVLWGFRDRDILEENGAKILVETSEELESFLSK